MTKITVKCTAVHDGDSIRVEDEAARLRYWLRLADIDAPEVYAPGFSTDQQFGKESGNQLRDLLKGKMIDIEVNGLDDYARRLAIVHHDGKEVNKMLVGTGLAWSFIGSPRYDEFKVYQKNARDLKVGLWALPGVKTRPSNWRKKNKAREVFDPTMWADEKM